MPVKTYERTHKQAREWVYTASKLSRNPSSHRNGTVSLSPTPSHPEGGVKPLPSLLSCTGRRQSLRESNTHAMNVVQLATKQKKGKGRQAKTPVQSSFLISIKSRDMFAIYIAPKVLQFLKYISLQYRAAFSSQKHWGSGVLLLFANEFCCIQYTMLM